MPSLEQALYLSPLFVYAIGALASPLDRVTRGAASHLTALVASLIGIAIAIRALVAGSSEPLLALSIAPFANISLRIDALGAYFVLVISLVGVCVSLYAIGYLRDEHGTTALGAAHNGFLATMVLVVLADSVFSFLFAWELMSLVSFFLVIFHHREAAVRRAGFVYLVMTHASSAFLLIAFLILFGGTGSLDFATIQRSSGSLPALTRDVAFLLSLVAFGTKAGVIPLHVWLPRAHPAAPSHVSALMSGVMIKMAIFGLLRVGWGLLGQGPAWWGGLLLVLGVVSAVLGVLYALMEHDLKRLLAYHSVENIGIILMGLGAAFLLDSLGYKLAAALALAACLYHVLNHAVFKALLFLCAGAVQRATHTRDLEALGGLIKRMPWTAAAFLVGAAAIAALPPLNGFVSEWLTFQALFAMGLTQVPALAVGGAAAAGLLALTGGLAVFCFVKAFGIAFLGMPRGSASANAREVNAFMLSGMAILALLCLALGLLPGVALSLLSPVTVNLVGAAAQPSLSLAPVAPPAGGAAYSPLALAGLLFALGGLAWLLARALGGRVGTRFVAPWTCGIKPEPGMQYTATALAKPVRIIFGVLLRPYRAIERHHAGAARYFVSAVRYEAGIHPIYERYAYRPAIRVTLLLAERTRSLQNGSLRTYLAYICATLIVLLLLAR